MVLDSLDKLIGACEARRESMVVEGVHLSLNSVVRLMQRHPSIVPFLIHISNEDKHRERFAVRSPLACHMERQCLLNAFHDRTRCRSAGCMNVRHG